MSHDPYSIARAKWDEFVVKTWFDRELYQKALSDPAFAVRAAGIEVPLGVEVLVVAQNASSWPFVLSEPPEGITERDAQKIETNLEHAEGTCPTGGAGTAHVYERV